MLCDLIAEDIKKGLVPKGILFWEK
ncbi:hypothetical protein [Flavivirga spongiicola]